MTLPGFDGLREYGKRGPTRVATVRTVHAAADRLAVSRWMVYQLIWDQWVKSVQIGRCRRIVSNRYRSGGAAELFCDPSMIASPA
jgi:hypothetical protein